MARYFQHPKTGEVMTEAEWIERYEYSDFDTWGGVAFWDAGLFEVIKDEAGEWRPLKTIWEFRKGGNIIETFDAEEDGLAWAVENGYIFLDITAPCEHPTYEILFFADINDLPDGMTDEDVEGNEQTILDYYGDGYEPCLYPREVK